MPARVSFSGDVPRGVRAVVLGGAGDGAVPRAARRGGRRGARPARAGEALLAGRERLGRRRDRAARPDRIAARRRGPRAADRLRDARDRAASRSTCAAGSSSRSTPGAAHDHAASGYNERRAECEAAARELGVEHLSDADAGRGRAAARSGPPARPPRADRERARRRHRRRPARGRPRGRRPPARRVPREPARRLRRVGRRRSRRPSSGSRRAGAAGARMMGGGFGGAVLALLPPGAALAGRCDRGRAGAAGAAALSLSRRRRPRAGATAPTR